MASSRKSTSPKKSVTFATSSLKRKFEDVDDGDLMDLGAHESILSSEEDSGDSDDEPNEIMEMPEGGLDNLPDVWLVKVPKSLMERWSTVRDSSVTLAKIRYHALQPGQSRPTITLHLPEPAQYDTSGESSMYNLVFAEKETQSAYVFTDRPKRKANGTAHRNNARSTQLVGKVRLPGTVIPVLDQVYMDKVKERNRQAHVKHRHTIMLGSKPRGRGQPSGGNALQQQQQPEHAVEFPHENLKMLTSGASRNDSPIKLGKPTIPGNKSPEKSARVARNDLIDMMLELFAEQETWTPPMIKERLDQPVQYIKDNLPMIAVYEASGPYFRRWRLNDTQKAMLAQSRGAQAGPSTPTKPQAILERLDNKMSDISMGDADEDSDPTISDDDEMEEIA